MDKAQAIQSLDTFKQRLIEDVGHAYSTQGSDYGRERFAAWRRQIDKFLDNHLPGTRARLDEKLTRVAFYRNASESDYDVFAREDGAPSIAFIDSLRLDIQNDEFDFEKAAQDSTPQAKRDKRDKRKPKNFDSVFIVHGHDETLKIKAARFVEKLGLKAVILHEQANQGKTIIEKIEANTDVGFAIVLYTPDDLGNTAKDAAAGQLKSRARQNVVFEHGYLMAKIGREAVVPLVSGNIELPSDISGIVYVNDSNWQIDIAKEMKATGYSVDFNALMG